MDRPALQGLWARWRHHLAQPVDAASFRVFLVGFGLLASFAALRFVAKGWLHALLLAPTVYFSWVPGLPAPTAPPVSGAFAVQALAGLAIAFGPWRRLALAAWLLSFGYVELLDKTLYLNHYVLFTLLGLTLLFAPRAALARRAPATVPRGLLTALRACVGLVYVWTGLCKLNPDWLLRGEPLRTWLRAKGGTPLLGPLLAWEPTALLMSWGGALYDLLIPFLLLYRPTRWLGVALVAFFHVVVGYVFPIGIFPVLMILGATLFLDPAWPRRGAPTAAAPAAPPWGHGKTLALTTVLLVWSLFPARFLLYPGNVNWTEQGYRFAWRVLLNEKTGLVDYRAVDRATGRVWKHTPSADLTPLQHQHLRTQPDMLWDYAQHLKEGHRQAGRDVAIYADVWVKWNGRPTRRLLRDDVDLTQRMAELRAQDWILPAPPPPTP